MNLCNEKITLYNCYFDSATRMPSYHRTVIDGVSWFGEIKSSVTDNGLVNANIYYIRIPTSATITGKTYVDKKTYESTASVSIDSYWTLNEGDIIVKGEVSDTGANATPAKLQKKYSNVVTIISITDNRRVINAPHWKVVCK